MNSLTVYETENTVSVSQNKIFDDQNLISIFKAVIDGVSQLMVNARDLHKFLKVGRRFTTWIQGRISEYQFAENLDFISFSQNGEKPKGGRPTIEYHLTLDTAKELAMVENNDEGRKVRRYFINCEKMLHKSDSEQRTSLRQACERLASGNMLISDAYKYVGSHFGYPDGIVDIPVSLLPDAIVFAYEMILSRQKPARVMDDDMVMNNRMWQDVGFTKTEQVYLMTQELSSLLARVSLKVLEIKDSHSTIFDSFNEQKWNGFTPEQLAIIEERGKKLL